MSTLRISRAVGLAFIVLGTAVGLGACGGGGRPSSTSGSGGASSSGGVKGTGGANGSGGASGTGGASSSGGTNGSGGVSSSGGTTGSGGASNSGGTNGTGGASSSGGTSASGGSGSGGQPATGGMTASGGSSGTGGQSSSGGAGGGIGSGGAMSTGGAGGGSIGTGDCIICEDFESSTSLDAAKWVIDINAAGKAEIVTSGAHGSGKAAKVSGGYIKIDAKAGLFTNVPSHFFMRVNMKFDMPQPSGHVTYLMLADKTKMGQLRIGAQNGGMIWNYDSNDTILPDYNAAAMSLKPPANEWHCFEFEIDGSAPLMRAWMDGTESPQMLLDSTSTSGIDDRWMRDMPGWKPNITNFSFGAGYPVGSSIIAWFDDIAISSARVGCQF